MATVTGTVAKVELLLESTIDAPPIGAGSPSVIVPFTVDPPTAVVESKEIDIGGSTLTFASIVTPRSVAVTVASTTLLTAEVGIVNVAPD